MQFDLFLDSRDVILRSHVLDQILARQPGAGRAAWARLADEYPDDAQLTPFDILLGVLESPVPKGAGVAAIETAAALLETVVHAAAMRTLAEASARVWLAQQWQGLAQAAAGLAYDADHTNGHAAALYLRAENWREAAAAVASIASWRRIPRPLAWMAQARLGSEGLEAAWPLLFELAWLAPARLDELARQSREPRLEGLLGRFNAEIEVADGDDLESAWFPAWCLIIEPAFAAVLRQTQPGADKPPERAARLLGEILVLEGQGNQAALPEARKRLRDLHSGLFARYMRSR